MISLRNTAHGAAMIVFALLCVGGTASLAAQQATSSPVQAAALPGPRMQPTMPRYEASLSNRAPVYMAAADLNDNHTLSITSLGLIILGVVALLILVL